MNKESSDEQSMKTLIKKFLNEKQFNKKYENYGIIS